MRGSVAQWLLAWLVCQHDHSQLLGPVTDVVASASQLDRRGGGRGRGR